MQVWGGDQGLCTGCRYPGYAGEWLGRDWRAGLESIWWSKSSSCTSKVRYLRELLAVSFWISSLKIAAQKKTFQRKLDQLCSTHHLSQQMRLFKSVDLGAVPMLPCYVVLTWQKNDGNCNGTGHFTRTQISTCLMIHWVLLMPMSGNGFCSMWFVESCWVTKPEFFAPTTMRWAIH